MLDHDEGGEQHDGEDTETERVQGDPALLRRLDEPVDERDQARGHRDGSGYVEGLVRLLVLRLRDVAEREHEGGDPDRDVDEEDPGPGEEVGEDPAEQEADCAAARGDRAPDAHRLRPLLALREGGGHDRERRGRDERRPEALEPAGEDQELGRGREPVQERGDGEDHEPDQEQPLSPDQVAGAPAEEQEAAEDQGVGVDHPLQLGRRHLEVLLDRGQRDVHDGRVQDDHELRHADEAEDEPGIGAFRGHRGRSISRCGRRRYGYPHHGEIASGRSETGSRRSAARRSATTRPSASAAARCGATSSRTRRNWRLSVPTAAARRGTAVPPAKRRFRRRSRSSARSVAPRSARPRFSASGSASPASSSQPGRR